MDEQYKKIRSGGSRKGSGAKQKYGEPTVLLSPVRCPISKVDEMKKLIKTKLTEYLK